MSLPGFRSFTLTSSKTLQSSFCLCEICVCFRQTCTLRSFSHDVVQQLVAILVISRSFFRCLLACNPDTYDYSMVNPDPEEYHHVFVTDGNEEECATSFSDDYKVFNISNCVKDVSSSTQKEKQIVKLTNT